MKKQEGMSMIMLIILIFIIIILSGLAINYINNKVEQEKFENIKTDMLSIQGKVKVLSQTSISSKDENILKGEKVIDNQEDIEVKQMIEKGIIQTDEESIKNYYILTNEVIEELGLVIENINQGKIIVNYKTNEIIYTRGVEVGGNIYYKLSEIENRNKADITKEEKLENNIENVQ